ncbi:unnamed protein product [Gongylonema pulchrum]|uniref:Uncharacterized protein n=1 Tax=Gongylonema pulchrum TaxID=637853 RepID=A0A183CV21_9BILA|nr:unnamed protein product [Gongylonema pulchrum]
MSKGNRIEVTFDLSLGTACDVADELNSSFVANSHRRPSIILLTCTSKELAERTNLTSHSTDSEFEKSVPSDVDKCTGKRSGQVVRDRVALRCETWQERPSPSGFIDLRRRTR